IGRHLSVIRIGISLQEGQPPTPANLVLVQRAGLEIGNEKLPNARAAETTHLMQAAVPAIKISDHTDPCGFRRPNGEGNALYAANPGGMCTQLFINAIVLAFPEQMKIEIAHRRQK